MDSRCHIFVSATGSRALGQGARAHCTYTSVSASRARTRAPRRRWSTSTHTGEQQIGCYATAPYSQSAEQCALSRGGHFSTGAAGQRSTGLDTQHDRIRHRALAEHPCPL